MDDRNDEQALLASLFADGRDIIKASVHHTEKGWRAVALVAGDKFYGDDDFWTVFEPSRHGSGGRWNALASFDTKTEAMRYVRGEIEAPDNRVWLWIAIALIVGAVALSAVLP